MQLFARLPKAQGLGDRNEVSHVSEFHGLIVLTYQSDINKLPRRIARRLIS